jgi:MFS family permease
VATWRQKGYDELPALSVRGRELRKSLRVVTAGYVLAVMFGACCAGSHVVVFMRAVGFRDVHFGLLAAVPFLATLAQLLAAVHIERTGLKKFQFIQCLTASRLLWLAVAAVPLLISLPSPAAVYVVLAVVLASSFAAAMGAPAWMTWMGDLIPKRIRGRYLGTRTLTGALIRLPVVVAIGIVLDVLSVPGRGGRAGLAAGSVQWPLLWATCVIFAVGAILGTIDILLFHWVRDVLPRVRPHEDQRVGPRKAPGLRALVVEPLRDRVFRRYVLYGATATFAATVGGSFFWLYAMEDLGFSKLAANVAFLVIGPVAGMSAARVWGRLIDSWGRRPVLVFATTGTLFSVSAWFFAMPDTPAIGAVVRAAVWVADALGGLLGRAGWGDVIAAAPVGAYLVACAGVVIGSTCWTGVTMTQTSVLFGFADGPGRSRYVAASSALIGLGGVLGGLAGGQLCQALVHYRAHPLLIGPFTWNNRHAVFALSLLARIAALAWAVTMPDPGAKPLRQVARVMWANVYNTVNPRLFYRLRVFGLPRRPPEDEPDDDPPAAGRAGGP